MRDGGATAGGTRALLLGGPASIGYVGVSLLLAAVGGFAIGSGRRTFGLTYEYGAAVVGGGRDADGAGAAARCRGGSGRRAREGAAGAGLGRGRARGRGGGAAAGD